MREIKFRVWSDFYEKYADFDAELYMDGSVEADFTDGTGIPHHETTDLVVEQYTGLKDKNGKEIYEGDIVQCGAYKGKVHYSVGVACYCVGDYTPIYQISRIENESFITLKVIGNIHDNPELLEEK